MNSQRCPHCGFTDWATATACKKCKHSFVAGEGVAPDQPIAVPVAPGSDNSYQATQADVPNVPDPPAAYQTRYTPPPTKKKFGLAVFSLVTGIFCVPPFFSIVLLIVGGVLALIFGAGGFIAGALIALAMIPTGLTSGIVALRRAKAQPDVYGGNGLAIGGIVCSSIGVIVIPLIAAIAIPNLLASRRAANEGVAIKSLRVLSAAQNTYVSTLGNGSCGEMHQLRSASLIDENLASGKKSGYRYELAFDSEKRSCYAYATPESSSTGSRSFLIASDGVIHGAKKNGALAELRDPPLDMYEVSPVAGGGSSFDARR